MKKWICILSVIILCVGCVGYGYRQVMLPYIRQITDQETLRFLQAVVNNTAFKHQKVSEKLIIVERNENNHISRIDVDMVYASAIAGEVVSDIEEVLFQIEAGTFQNDGSTIYQKKLQEVNDQKAVIGNISMLAFLETPFLSDIGPYMHVRYHTLSHVSSEVEKDIKSYGVSHIVVSIDIKVTISLKVVSPFIQETIEKEITFPLALEIIQGDVPNWYQN